MATENENGCTKTAEWSINYGPTSDDYTEACSAHVGFLLHETTNTITPTDSASRAACCYIEQP